jgi:hypothetical protein
LRATKLGIRSIGPGRYSAFRAIRSSSRGLGVAQHALHAAAFKLEHGLGRPSGTACRWPCRRADVLVGKSSWPGWRHDELARQLQDGQRGQAQKVELHQADGLHVVLVVLADGRVAAGLLVQRAEVGQLARRDQHAAGVHADVARHALELLRQLEQGRTSSLDALGQIGSAAWRIFLLAALGPAAGIAA